MGWVGRGCREWVGGQQVGGQEVDTCRPCHPFPATHESVKLSVCELVTLADACLVVDSVHVCLAIGL